MTGNLNLDGGDGGAQLAIETLPKAAIQALYHAVTGKTENYRKTLSGNVLINFVDIERLYQLICQQLEHYQLLAKPTVTVVLKTDNSRSLTYSSWERYKALEINTAEITSEVILKIEFVASLPNTPTPQRCILNINLDSSLPMLNRGNEFDDVPFIFAAMYLRQWQTVEISIDFVDFLIARNFVSQIEEWFTTLQRVPDRKFEKLLAANMQRLDIILGQSGRFGSAFFIAFYVFFSGNPLKNFEYFTYAVTISFMIWGIIQISAQALSRSIKKRVNRNIIPSVIVLTNGDKIGYKKLLESTTSTSGTVARLAFTPIFSILFNIVASFLYVWLTRPK